MRFYIDDFNYSKIKSSKRDKEYRLHLIDGIVFFILKLKNSEYYTSQLYEYELIKDDIKEWLINEIDKGEFLILNDYDYDMIINPMFRKIIRGDKLDIILKRGEN